MVLNRLKDRLRARFHLAVAEVDHQDLWQRSALALVGVAAERDGLEQTLNAAIESVERELPGEVLSADTEWLV